MDEQENQERGIVDGLSLIYVAGGIPAMVLFFLVLFFFANTCDLPA